MLDGRVGDDSFSVNTFDEIDLALFTDISYIIAQLLVVIYCPPVCLERQLIFIRVLH